MFCKLEFAANPSTTIDHNIPNSEFQFLGNISEVLFPHKHFTRNTQPNELIYLELNCLNFVCNDEKRFERLSKQNVNIWKTRWVWRSRRHCRGKALSSKGPSNPPFHLSRCFIFSPSKELSFHLWIGSIFSSARTHFCHNFLPYFSFSLVLTTTMCYILMWVFRLVLATNSIPQWSHWDDSPSPGRLSLIMIQERGETS